ncbi:MAG: MBL fold metallo-hydrolase [Variovorax sp.]
MIQRLRTLSLGFGLCLASAGLALGVWFLFPSTAARRVIDKAPAELAPIELKGTEGAAPLTVTRIAHATVLLDFDGLRVLTDPWFTEKNHFHQGEPLGIAFKDLPPLDLIVASHAHYDHFDLAALAAYPNKNVPFLVGPDMAPQARAAGFTQVRELKPWESWRQGEFTVTGVPARHKVPELTFMIQAKGRSVYFGGDTLLIPELLQLPKMFPSIDLALLSVNGLSVFGEQVVMNAEEAAELASVLGARVAVPMHYRFVGSWFTDTLVLGRNGTPERFVAAASRLAPSTQVRVLEPGQPQLIR